MRTVGKLPITTLLPDRTSRLQIHQLCWSLTCGLLAPSLPRSAPPHWGWDFAQCICRTPWPAGLCLDPTDGRPWWEMWQGEEKGHPPVSAPGSAPEQRESGPSPSVLRFWPALRCSLLPRAVTSRLPPPHASWLISEHSTFKYPLSSCFSLPTSLHNRFFICSLSHFFLIEFLKLW